MHVACLAADKGFVGRNRACHLIDSPMVLSVPNAVKHEPRSFLRDFQCSTNFIGTDAVFAVRKQPHCGEPFIETNCRILEDRADLNAELFAAFKARPYQASLEKRKVLGLAARTFWAFWPLRLGNSFKAHHSVRKVPNGLHQTTVNIECFCFHASSILLEAV